VADLIIAVKLVGVSTFKEYCCGWLKPSLNLEIEWHSIRTVGISGSKFCSRKRVFWDLQYVGLSKSSGNLV
jgi:hypothetical protein